MEHFTPSFMRTRSFGPDFNTNCTPVKAVCVFLDASMWMGSWFLLCGERERENILVDSAIKLIKSVENGKLSKLVEAHLHLHTKWYPLCWPANIAAYPPLNGHWPSGERWFRPFGRRWRAKALEHHFGWIHWVSATDWTHQDTEITHERGEEKHQKSYISLCIHTEAVLDEFVDHFHAILLGGKHDGSPSGARTRDLRIEPTLIRVIQQIVAVLPVALLAKR